MKRLFDLSAALIGLILLAPIILILAILIRQKIGSPVFFTQEHPGLHGKPFKMMKFRTMTDARDAEGKLLPDNIRLTPFGRFLRTTSLDEQHFARDKLALQLEQVLLYTLGKNHTTPEELDYEAPS